MSFYASEFRRYCIAAVAALSIATGAAAWQPAEGPLKTRWSKDVSPEKAWPDYPRPQMVRTEWTNLNGLWQYAIRPANADKPANWDGEILVPFPVESALSGVKKAVNPAQTLWYRRTFTSTLKTGERLLLHFGAVDWQCTVWVNGKQVGEHAGGYEPFTFDITDALHAGENEVIVSVNDPTDSGTQPHGKQYLKPRGIWYTAVTGIWQTVWLEPVPNRHIRALTITPDIDTGDVAVHIDASAPGEARARVRIDKADSNTVFDAGGDEPTLRLKTAGLKHWTPDQPILYDLEVALLDRGKVVDRVTSYFGMRKIEVKKDAEGVNRLWLNNKVLFQYGPLDQGWWPDGLYTPPTDEAMKYDIAMTKRLGMNMARKHVKVEPDRWYYWCDKLGLMVWQDMPSGETGRNDEAKAEYRKELAGMIDALRNHPSIVMWVPFNEGWGQHDTPQTVEFVKKLDPTRPVNEASGWNNRHSGDVADMHSYPGPGMRELEPKRVCVLGEFGGLGMPVRGHTWQQEKSWGYVSYENSKQLTDAYVDLLTAMRPLVGRGLSAAVYTQTSDVEVEVNGLMTYDREELKMDESRIKSAAEKLYAPPPKLTVLVPTSEQHAQTWHFTTSKPKGDWYASDFGDRDWETGPGGFGTEGTPGAIVRTKWSSPDIWIRRSFELKPGEWAGQLAVTIHHDDDAEVYVNGKLLRSFKRHTNGYQIVYLNDEEQHLLTPGKNTLAVHCHQTGGGQYIDAGLMAVKEAVAGK